MTDFATIDIETTGLHPARDRILEVAIVRTSSTGEVIEEFETLVNPRRDVGPTRIHGISASDIAQAPELSDVLGDIAYMLNGAILVAHNASFDARFLQAELKRADRRFDPMDPLCTLQLMYSTRIQGPRRLTDCCNYFGIETGHHHFALDDARMASQLLHQLLNEYPTAGLPSPVRIDPKPESIVMPVPRTNVVPIVETQSTYLQSLIGNLSADRDVGLISAANVAQYLNLLDDVLLDRRIDSSESELLVEFAEMHQLTRATVHGIHASYVTNLCLTALRDGDVTELERSDIETVAGLLGVRDWESIVEGSHLGSSMVSTNVQLAVGTTVCFTGEMSQSRLEMNQLAERHRLITKSSVSRSLDVLVLADSDSESGKARKAREYGVRIVTEAVFRQMLPELP